MPQMVFSFLINYNQQSNLMIQKIPKTRMRNAVKMTETENSVIHFNMNHHAMTMTFLILLPGSWGYLKQLKRVFIKFGLFGAQLLCKR